MVRHTKIKLLRTKSQQVYEPKQILPDTSLSISLESKPMFCPTYKKTLTLKKFGTLRSQGNRFFTHSSSPHSSFSYPGSSTLVSTIEALIAVKPKITTNWAFSKSKFFRAFVIL